MDLLKQIINTMEPWDFEAKFHAAVFLCDYYEGTLRHDHSSYQEVFDLFDCVKDSDKVAVLEGLSDYVHKEHIRYD